MNNEGDLERLRAGAEALGVTVDPGAAAALLRYREELLRWNAKVNLTAITAPDEVLEKHLVDSLAALPFVGAAKTVLDLGAGAGLPGVPLKVARPELQVTLVDAVAKKVGFIKAVVAALGLKEGIRAVHVRLEGKPEKEGLARAELVVCRAFMPPETWLPFAVPYLADGGRALSMMGPAERPAVDEVAKAHGFVVEQFHRYALPYSGAARAIATFRRS